MNFIERWFGVSPDGGDGTLELLYVVLAVLLLVSIAWYRVYRHRMLKANRSCSDGVNRNSTEKAP
jgi:type III secretory pathway component EscU